jgi:hypothetical protein
MKCDFKTLPLILYQIYNVIVSLSLFVVVYTISHQKTFGLFAQRWWGKSECECLRNASDVLTNLHPLWSYGMYIVLVIVLTWIVTLFFPKLDDDEMQNGASIKSVEDASLQFFPNYLAYFFVALSASDKYAVLIVFLIMLVLSYLSNTMLYNPLLVLFKYRYYLVVNGNNKRSLVITRRLLNPAPAEPISFPKLKRLNDNTFIEFKD